MGRNKVVGPDQIPIEAWRCLGEDGVRENLGVRSIIDKLREGRIRWFGYVMRRPPLAPVRRVKELTVDGVGRRGRPSRRWEDKLRIDMNELLLTDDMTSDRDAWMARIRLAE
ncbi:uncharacterized protein [Rutidosis leptorrhynchoides]|uniref:uncharacterized protein n=1 Tax=Rutidosis leptorrhynchoides TaxID=125765 RepID=UPI003A98E8E6